MNNRPMGRKIAACSSLENLLQQKTAVVDRLPSSYPGISGRPLGAPAAELALWLDPELLIGRQVGSPEKFAANSNYTELKVVTNAGM